MKICVLTDSWMPVWGGGQGHILEVYNRLSARGFGVDLIIPNLVGNHDLDKKAKFQIIPLGPKFVFPDILGRTVFAFCSLWYVLTTDYDLYHSHNYSTSAFLPIARLFGKKIAFTLHGMGVKGLEAGGGIVSFVNKTGIGWLMNKLVLDLWPYDLKFSASKYKDFVTVGNGVDVGEYDLIPSIKHNKFRVFWIGRKSDPVKGVKYLEEAVKGLSVDLDLAENVYGEEKIKRFKTADLFVLPSLSEGLPLVLLEAMAAKLPVITTDVGDCRNIVEEARCGMVINSVADLKSAIAKIRKAADLKIMGERGYEYVKKHYSWKKVADIYSNHYRRLDTVN